MPHNILIITHNAKQKARLGQLARQYPDCQVEFAHDKNGVVLVLEQERAPHLLLVDCCFSAQEQAEIASIASHVPLVAITEGKTEKDVFCQMGREVTFIENRVISEQLPEAIKTIFKGYKKIDVPEPNKKVASFADIIGKSPLIREAIALGERSSRSTIPVLLEGESGVGKELFAAAIHSASDRKDKPFIAVNCGAIPENLVESILFGHEKGAFTGALYKTLGKFREADGGTLFLDEIGELKQDMQVKLLRALQEGEIEPVGGKMPVKVNIRVISATNRTLSKQVKGGTFREDLYYRLNVFPIHIPPLRERQGDIPLILEHFYRAFSAEERKTITGIEEGAYRMLCQHEWPGNVRQLKNAVFRAVVLCDGTMLHKKDFLQVISDAEETLFSENIAWPVQEEKKGGGGYNLPLMGEGHFRSLHDIERDVIQTALEHYCWHMSEAARRLGIGRSTLYRKITDFQIVPPFSKTELK